MIKVLFPIRDILVGAPGHLLFGANYFNKVSKGSVEVIYYPYRQQKFDKLTTLRLNFQIALKALMSKHDALYYGTDPSNLVILAILKKMGIYKKPMYAWKYSIIHKSENRLKNIVKSVLYNSFSKIFMITENHVPESYAEGIVHKGQLQYMKWGEDLGFVDSLNERKNDKFTFISTGKAHRDFVTLFAAFRKIEGVCLKIYAPYQWGDLNYKEQLKDTPANTEVVFVGKEITLEHIFRDMKRSHCALCICEDINFGVGYTQILDSLACGLPVIWTQNKDNPIDVEREGVGLTVHAGSVDDLEKAMKKMMIESDKTNEMVKKARTLIEDKYNIELVATEIVGYIRSHCIQKVLPGEAGRT